MTIENLLKLQSGDQIKVNQTPQSVLSSRVMPDFRTETNIKGETTVIDLSYVELIHTGGALYSGPPVRLHLDLPQVTLASTP